LAFKVIQNNGSNKTCIFDEIDTGIGGEIGVVIGKKICDISKKTQVICVTHLSQIASFGDANYKIEKFEEDNKTITTVKFLNEENKILEIARMIGNSNNLSAINHAREIIEEANQYKNYINS
jgi:DNA repair protein RecN (Recombination protein N)